MDLPDEQSLEYTVPMRIFGGVAWGSVLTITVGSILVIIPQYPRPWLWVVPGLWVGLSLLGITLQWSVARGACPKCGLEQTVPSLGKRCPECRSYLKAVDRKIIRY